MFGWRYEVIRWTQYDAAGYDIHILTGKLFGRHVDIKWSGRLVPAIALPMTPSEQSALDDRIDAVMADPDRAADLNAKFNALATGNDHGRVRHNQLTGPSLTPGRSGNPKPINA